MRQTEDGQPIDSTGKKAGGSSPTKPAAVVEGRVTAVRAKLEANYRQVQYHYVQFLADHLTDCRKSVGGDFDDLMMLAVLGQRFLDARRGVDNGEDGAETRIWMSALRLSDVTGVPRESVRRKLLRLAQRGWVTQDPAHGWRIAGSLDEVQARIDLGELDSRGLDRLARLLVAVMPLLSEKPTEAGQSDESY